MKRVRILKSHFYAEDRDNHTLCETKSRNIVTVSGSVTCKRCAWLILGIHKPSITDRQGKFLKQRKG